MLVPAGIVNNNDSIAVVAPSSPFNRELLLKGIKKIESEGFKVVYSERIFSRGWDELPYFAGSPEERAGEINKFFKDPSIKAIMAARGGYGSNLTAELIDYEIIKKNPKIFMGFSDITFLLNVIHERSNIITYHGPMVGSDRFLSCVKADFDIFLNVMKYPSHEIRISFNPENFKNSRKTGGKIAGGNLTMLTTMTGTPFDFSTEGKILFIEDINEADYRIDRMLTHLKQAGKFKKLGGIVFGEMLSCGTDQKKLFEIIDHLNIDVPVLTNFPFGHGNRNVVIPVGGYCEIDPSSEIVILRGRK